VLREGEVTVNYHSSGYFFYRFTDHSSFMSIDSLNALGHPITSALLSTTIK
jgi:hypothetical protein